MGTKQVGIWERILGIPKISEFLCNLPFFQGPSTRSRRRRRYPAPAQHTTGACIGRRHCCDRATGGQEPASCWPADFRRRRHRRRGPVPLLRRAGRSRRRCWPGGRRSPRLGAGKLNSGLPLCCAGHAREGLIKLHAATSRTSREPYRIYSRRNIRISMDTKA